MNPTIMQSHTLKIASTATLGTVLEWAEYTFYAYMATDIARLFFPHESSSAGLIAAFGIFAAGYLMRPLGALIFGRMGDSFGRKTALLTAMLLMSLSTLGIGLLPTYQSIGLAAPVLLLVLRCLQGLSVASEMNGASIFLIEHLKDRPNLMGSFISSAAACGMLLGGLAATITSLPGMPDFAWRIPFLMGFFISLMTMYWRRVLPETPTFLHLQHHQKLNKQPVLTLFKHHKKSFMIVLVVAAFVNIYVYVCNLYFTSHLIEYLHFNSTDAKLLASLGEAVVMVFLPLFGWLADRQDANKLMRIGLLSTVIIAPCMFLLAQTGQFLPALLGQLLYGVSNAMACAPIFKFLFDQFPADIRCSGNAIAWSVSAAIFGGTAPLLSQYMTHQWHANYAPATYVAVSALVAYFTVWVVTSRTSRLLSPPHSDVALGP